MEGLPGLDQSCQQATGFVPAARCVPERREGAQDLVQPAVVGVLQQASAEGRESGAHDHAQVHVRGRRDDLVLQHPRGLVDHGQYRPVPCTGGIRDRARRRQAHLRIHGWIEPLLLAAFVPVEAEAPLPSRPPGLGQCDQGCRGRHPIAEFVRQNCPRVADNVDPDLVDEATGPHRHAEIGPDPVQRHDLAPFVEQVSGLVEARSQDSVHQESRPVPRDDGDLPETDHQGGDRLDRAGIGLFTPHDLDQGHAMDRVEEVHPPEPPGALQRRGHLADRQRRGIRRDHGFGPDGRLDLPEHRPLDVHAFDHGFHDQVRAPHTGVVEPARNQAHFPHRGAAAERPALHGAVEERARMGETSRHGLVTNVPHPHGDVVVCRQLGDSAPHLPGSDHRHPLHRRRAASVRPRPLAGPLTELKEEEQVPAHRRFQQRAHALGFQLQALGDRPPRALADDVQELQRGGVVAPGALQDLLARGPQDKRAPGGCPVEDAGHDPAPPPGSCRDDAPSARPSAPPFSSR